MYIDWGNFSINSRQWSSAQSHFLNLFKIMSWFFSVSHFIYFIAERKESWMCLAWHIMPSITQSRISSPTFISACILSEVPGPGRLFLCYPRMRKDQVSAAAAVSVGFPSVIPAFPLRLQFPLIYMMVSKQLIHISFSCFHLLCFSSFSLR